MIFDVSFRDSDNGACEITQQEAEHAAIVGPDALVSCVVRAFMFILVQCTSLEAVARSTALEKSSEHTHVGEPRTIRPIATAQLTKRLTLQHLLSNNTPLPRRDVMCSTLVRILYHL